MARACGHAAHSHPDMDVATGAVDYAIQIPANHPSGLYWFHPHVHGVALNQVTAGLSGIITIGTPESMCGDATCVSQVKAGTVRHIVLKDMQILAGNTLQTQQDPDFCGGPDQPASPPRWRLPRRRGRRSELCRRLVVPYRQRPGLSHHRRQARRRHLAHPELLAQPFV